MGDGASSSNSLTGGGAGEGGGGGGGESLVVDQGKRRSSCGYCRSTGYTSISQGLWAHRLTVDDYQDLLDRGWRRSGCFLYKPEMDRTCCPSYTIRLKAGDFVPSKEQLRVHKKMQRYLDGTVNMKQAGQLKKRLNSPEGLENMNTDAPSTAILAASEQKTSAGVRDKKCAEDNLVDHLSNKIDESISLYINNGEFSSSVQLPKAVVKQVSTKAKRKLAEISEDLLYTSTISFQIAAALKRGRSAEVDIGSKGSSSPRENGELLDISPKIVAEKLAPSIARNCENCGLIIKACNGHLNFYSAFKQPESFPIARDKCMQISKNNSGECKRSSPTHSIEVLPCKRRKLEIRMKQSSFDPEEFDLYRRYQIKIHNDKPEKVTESSYRRFLVDTPLVFVPPNSRHMDVPPCGFGSFHQQYVVDGKLVAVGVVDVLPRCLSSKYLFWDPDHAFLSLGKYSALQEINWVKEAEAHCPSLQYYYLGYYIHSCRKMRYKAAYWPSELLCPLRYKWVPYEVARPLLDKKSYVVLSEYTTLRNEESSQLPASTDRPVSSDENYLDEPSTDEDEDEEIDLDHDGSDTGVDNESDSEPSNVLYTDDLAASDVGNIVIDLNGSRVRFKDLQQMIRHKRHLNDLVTQLQRYARAVGKELSNRMVYYLG